MPVLWSLPGYARLAPDEERAKPVSDGRTDTGYRVMPVDGLCRVVRNDDVLSLENPKDSKQKIVLATPADSYFVDRDGHVYFNGELRFHRAGQIEVSPRDVTDDGKVVPAVYEPVVPTAEGYLSELVELGWVLSGMYGQRIGYKQVLDAIQEGAMREAGRSGNAAKRNIDCWVSVQEDGTMSDADAVIPKRCDRYRGQRCRVKGALTFTEQGPVDFFWRSISEK